jgi:ABC-type sugar transport system ATPase subunit
MGNPSIAVGKLNGSATVEDVTDPVLAALQLRNITRRFGGTLALTGVDLDVEAGTIHALVGENGAGKSTLLGIVAGRIAPSDGTGMVFDQPLPVGDPRAARTAGIVAIYQELTTVPSLSARANVFLGLPESRYGWLATRTMTRRFIELTSLLGVNLDPGARAGSLSVADQQVLEVMRALQAQARIILFDEPTAALGAPERRGLLRLMSDLRTAGVTMLFVSHNLSEVLEIADRISVFRDGRLLDTRPASEWTKAALVRAMLGDKGQALAGAMLARPTKGAPPQARAAGRSAVPSAALSVRDLSVARTLHQVSLDLNAGEIVGIAGLVGSGRTTLLRALAGVERISSGSMNISGREIQWPRTVYLAIRHGIALIPEDRKAQGLIPGLSASRNITLSDRRSVAFRGWTLPRRMRHQARVAGERVGFDSGRLDEPVRNLSGGNQQKVLIARWAHRPPTVLLADEPTRGIDVGSKAQILETLQTFARAGMAIAIVSSEHEELLSTADRIIVLAHGRVVAELDNRTQTLTENDILTAAFDVERTHANA